jgi:hypothetical protein
MCSNCWHGDKSAGDAQAGAMGAIAAPVFPDMR